MNWELMLACVLVATALGGVSAWLQARAPRRTRLLRAFALERGLEWLGWRPDDGRLRSLSAFRYRGGGRYRNTMLRRWSVRGRTFELRAGDFEGIPGEDGLQGPGFSYVALHTPDPDAPDLSIRRERFWHRAAETLGFDDVDFESAEFSRRFRVRARCRRFACDLIQPAVMELLLASRCRRLELRQGALVIHSGWWPWSTQRLAEGLELLAEIAESWPGHAAERVATEGRRSDRRRGLVRVGDPLDRGLPG